MNRRAPTLALLALPLALGLVACDKKTSNPDDSAKEKAEEAADADAEETKDDAEDSAPAGGW